MISQSGIVKYQNKYYKSLIKIDNEYYSDVNELVKDVKNKQRKLKQFYIPTNIQIDYNKDFKSEYAKVVKSLKQSNLDLAKIYKNRYYLQLIDPEKSSSYPSKVLTFILFNSSFANQFKLDPSIQNCAYLTFDKYDYEQYTGMEIFNLFTLRNSNNILQDTDEIDKNLEFILNELSNRNSANIVLGWGFGKSKQYKKRISKVLECLDISKLRQISHKDNPEIMLHPDNRYWNLILKNPFKQNAIITEYKY